MNCALGLSCWHIPTQPSKGCCLRDTGSRMFSSTQWMAWTDAAGVCSFRYCRPCRQVRCAVADVAKQELEDGSSFQTAVPPGSKKTAKLLPKAEVEELLTRDSLNILDIAKMFPFKLDSHQESAIIAVLDGHSLVVSAPTGSGKTAIAEAATLATLARGQRVIYTTPLKALSNQKLFEFRRMFGTERVGLQTGDASLNAEGDVVVMTTEVMRNIMYRTAHDHSTGRSGACERLGNVGLLVLDEVHYLGDPSRGSVWEEVIINCPPHIQMLAMSATIANADDLGDWINKVHGSCKTMVSAERPVPLAWHYCYESEGQTTMKPLFDSRGRRVNRELVLGPPEDSWYRPSDGVAAARSRLQAMLERHAMADTVGFATPSTHDVIQYLKEAGMLPAIWFIFSRAQCDAAAALAQQAGMKLSTSAQRAAIKREVTKLRQEQAEAVREALVPALLAGIASHHAGCLPGWKSLIETLFQRGLLQLVFATETLAAGINMPARSTVLSTSSRRRAEGPTSLTHNELMQMAGRAGRRGYDTHGFCVRVHHAREEAAWTAQLLLQGPEPLQSQFESGYGMALNLLFSRSLSQAKDFIDRSFSAYLSGEGRARRLREIQQWEESARAMEVAAAKAEAVAGGAEAAFRRYESLRLRLRERRRALKAVLEQAVGQRSLDAAAAVEQTGLPCVCALELDPVAAAMGGSGPLVHALSALLVAELEPPVELVGRASFLSHTWYLCLTADNRLLRMRAEHVSHITPEGGRWADVDAAAGTATAAAAKAVDWTQVQGGAFAAAGTLNTAPAAAILGSRQQAGALALSAGFMDSIDALEEEIRGMGQQMQAEKQAAGKMRSVREDLELRAKAAKLRKRVRQAHRDLEGQSQGNWQAFEVVVAILVAAQALQPGALRPTPLGQVAREVHGANPLWLATVLLHPAAQMLKPPQLAGLLGAMVAADAVSRPHITAAYRPSDAIVHAVEAMEPDRSHLFDLQMEGRVEFPLDVDLRLAGVVEAWAAGSAWTQVMSDCNLDDGDIARLLSRTVDLLRQAGHCSALASTVRSTARQAAAAMTRAPISELIS